MGSSVSEEPFLRLDTFDGEPLYGFQHASSVLRDCSCRWTSRRCLASGPKAGMRGLRCVKQMIGYVLVHLGVDFVFTLLFRSSKLKPGHYEHHHRQALLAVSDWVTDPIP